ncbi:MAG: hypothetical protein QJT81_07315 [Candidatus Thiothrix putei]|uniref:Uncharacterized protein n=1 Tax=Candidatus Thiothrix putei TaxID=3080811 RepID=A0AA95HH52_9GAMM|nr:MAG: hypothetical protein QJT81_07315 [Candidatus Thiothrix putei]
MKTLQGIVLLATCLTASQVQAQDPPTAVPQPAAPDTLTFPPQQGANTQQATSQPSPPSASVGQPGPRFPAQVAPQTQPQTTYPYSNGNYTNYNYRSYGYPTYPYSYYPYAQQQAYNPYAQAYNPYAQQPMYNPYATPRMMPYPQRPPVPQKKETKPWGDTRYIWPDFYTDFTGDAFDKMINAPYDMGRMPGGWKFPSISMPDPVTVSDAIANQVPPFAEEAGNMVPVDDMGNIVPFK